MGAIDHAKDLASLIKKLGNIELDRKIVDLQGEIIDLEQKNRELKEEIRELKENLKYHGSLLWKDNAYWKEGKIDAEHGPYCSGCRDSNSKLSRLTSLGCENFKCPVCKADYDIKSLLKSDKSHDDSINFSEGEINILKYLSKNDGSRMLTSHIVGAINLDSTRTQHFIDKLVAGGFIEPSYTMGEQPRYEIDSKGRKYLIENDLI